jgi:hypothetical protein
MEARRRDSEEVRKRRQEVWELLFKLKDWCATVIRTYSTMAIFT